VRSCQAYNFVDGIPLTIFPGRLFVKSAKNAISNGSTPTGGEAHIPAKDRVWVATFNPYWRRSSSHPVHPDIFGEKPGNAFWFRSNPEMTQWTEPDAKVLVHAPVFGFWNDSMFIGGRAKAEDGYVTRFWRASGGALEELITLPSRGDTSYPGLIVPPPEGGGEPALLVSWYSQHESGGNKNQAAVYVGRVVLAPKGGSIRTLPIP